MYVSIDIETTGLNPDTCQVIEFGAVTSEGAVFQRYIDNGIISGEPFSLSMHSEIFKRMAESEDLIKPYQLAIQFKGFLDEEGVGDRFIVAGKNYAMFDNMFLRALPHWRKLIKHDPRILDPGHLYWKPEKDGHNLPGLKRCMARAGISGDVPHNAVADAMIVKTLVDKYVKNRSNKIIS